MKPYDLAPEGLPGGPRMAPRGLPGASREGPGPGPQTAFSYTNLAGRANLFNGI